PLLDALERMYPALRAAYMDEKSLAIARDAEAYEERYGLEGQRLRDREAERRWKGEPLDEMEVRRIASVLKSYNEMMQGERFVVKEVRSRERERHRGWIALVLMGSAMAVA